MDRRECIVFIAASVLLAPSTLFLGDVHPVSEASAIPARPFTVPQDFIVGFSSTDYNASGGVLYESTLNLSSNGSARFRDSWSSPNLGESNDLSAVLSDELVDFAREMMDEDDLCSLNGTYNDARWHPQTMARHVDKFFIDTPCGNRSLRFLGDAMIGILPRTCVAIDKLIWQVLEPEDEVLNISIEVNAQLVSDAKIIVSAVVQNQASHEYSMSGVCSEIWPAVIVRANGCSVTRLPVNNLLPTCVVTVGPGATYHFESQTIDRSGLATGSYVIMVTPGLSGMTVLEITDDLGHVNSPPIILVDAVEVAGSGSHTFEFDASESCDVEDIATDLEVRWDWLSDGTWDIDWSVTKSVRHTFADMTGYNFTIEVRDKDNAVSAGTMSMSVERGLSLVVPVATLSVVIVSLLLVAAFILLRRRPS